MFAFGGATWQTPWREVLRQASVGFVYATCCIALGNLAMPRLAPVVRRRLWFPFDWAIVSLALVVLAMIACAGAVVILTAVGHYQVDQMKTAWTASVKSASYFTLLFGIMATIIGELQGRLDRATLDIRTKERDEAEARRLAVEAQLASLESRVDPHFFFNTLNSIAALVRDDPSAAERVVEKLAAVMRSSLDRGGSALVSLEQEVGFVRNYLEIERVRFGDRLRYDLSIGEPAGRTLVPRLSLQTLVENSVKYAVSPRREGACIIVRAATQLGRTRIEVEDNGPGFNGVDLSNLPGGHGLALLDARLRLQFGAAAEMGIDSVHARTCIWFDVPSPPTSDVAFPSHESRVK
jgi:two-component system sensor histidine kinase AlgZ